MAANGKMISTFCRICEAYCGINVEVADNRVLRIQPDKDNPLTWRDFCPKGRTAAELIDHPRRLRVPLRRVGDRYLEASWDEAVDEIADVLRRLVDTYGPDSIGIYQGNPTGFNSGAVLFGGAFARALGTTNVFGVGSVDQNALHVVCREMYGVWLLPLLPDVDACRYFLLLGMNPAHTTFGWIGSIPDGWKRALATRRHGGKIVVVDPRRTPTAEDADLHLAIRPGQDWAFLLGLVKVILDNGWERPSSAGVQMSGLDELRAVCGEVDLADLADRCGIEQDRIITVATEFAGAETAVCVAHTGVAQNITGTLGDWLSQVLNFLTDRVDVPGGRRFEPGFVDIRRFFGGALGAPSRVRGLPAIAGTRSLAEMADEITTPGPGQVRALILHAGNPVISGPEGQRLDAALTELELLVSIDLFQRVSSRHADWLLPDAHFLEREDMLLNRSSLEERPFVQFGQQAVQPPEGVRENWEFWLDLAIAMDLPFMSRTPLDAEAKAARVRARAERRPELGMHPAAVQRRLLARSPISYDDIRAHPHGWCYAERTFGHFAEYVSTPDGAVRLAPEAFTVELRRVLAAAPPCPPASHPYTLIARRHRESMNGWLNEVPGLHRRTRRNSLEIGREDAAREGLSDGDTVAVVSTTGARIELPVVVSDALAVGVVVSEHGWGSGILDPAGGGKPESYGANRNVLTPRSAVDPLSAMSALNGGTHVALLPIEVDR